MERYREGDALAFELLLGRYRQPVFSFLFRSVQDRALAEDLFQETFLRLIRMAQNHQNDGSDRCDQPGQFKTWIYRVAYNLSIDARRRARQRVADSLDQPMLQQDRSGSPLELTEDQQAALDRKAMGRQLGSSISQAVLSLEVELRDVFLMREMTELSFRQIADIMHLPYSTVRRRMQDALRRLRLVLEEHHDAVQVAR